MRDYRELNRRRLAAYLQDGCKHERFLGFKLEHVLLHGGNNASVGYSEEHGVRRVFEMLAETYGEPLRENGEIVGLKAPDSTVMVGPAGQIEFSARPLAGVEEIERVYLDFRNHLDPILDELGLVTPMLGYNPSARAEDLEPVPRHRYDCMTRYLGRQSYAGVCMMRGSSSVMVSVDFENETDAMRKLRIAQAIAPILSLMCDNSPVFEGEERVSDMVRAKGYSDMQQDRVGTIPGSMAPGYSFDDYADYILTRRAIYVPDGAEPEGGRYVGDETFDEVYANREMTAEEIGHALSMVWPDVRLRTYLKIRAADAMPIEYCLAYTVLIRALFYSDRNLRVLESMLGNVGEWNVAQAKGALMEGGYGAEVYGRPAEFWADLLLVLASGALEPGEAAYLEPLSSMTKHRFTLAGIWSRLMEKRHDMPSGSPEAPVIGVVPRYDFEWTGLAISDGYLSGLLEVGAVPVVLPLTSDAAHIARLVNSCDGFLIPGGQDIDPSCYGARREPRTHRSATSRDSMERALILAALAAGKPILGICRGMQSINVTLGGTLCQDIASHRAETAPDGSTTAHMQKRPFESPAHMVDVDPRSQLGRIVGATRLGVNTIHHQCVDKLGSGLVVNAVSVEDGVPEGIEMPSARFVIGVQWHPEYMWRRRPHSKRLFRALVEAAAEKGTHHLPAG